MPMSSLRVFIDVRVDPWRRELLPSTGAGCLLMCGRRVSMMSMGSVHDTMSGANG